MRPETLPELMTADEVAAILRVSKYSVYRWAEAGDLPSLRISGTVRFRRADIEALLTINPGRFEDAS